MTDAAARRILTFSLAHEDFGVPMRVVRDVIDLSAGVEQRRPGGVTWRGVPIPLVDLHVTFGLPIDADGHGSSVIVCDVGHGSRRRFIGFLVDELSNVETLDDCELEAVADEANARSEYGYGVATVRNTGTRLIDVNALTTAVPVARAA